MNDFSLTFVTHEGCHLCEEALPVVARVSRRLRVPLQVVEMDDDDDLVRLYVYRVPVVLDSAGTVLAETRIEERGLRKAVRAARRAARRRSV